MDTRSTIFVRPATSDQPLKDFAAQMFGWLGIPSFEEEWWGKGDVQMFVGSAVGVTVTISKTPFQYWMEPHRVPNLEKYAFKISLSPQGKSRVPDYLVHHAHMLALRLSQDGFRCFIPNDEMTVKSEEDGKVYDV